MIQRKQSVWLALIALLCFSSVYLNIPFREVEGKLDGKLIEDAFAHIGFSKTTIEIAKIREKNEPNTLLRYSTLLLGLTSLAGIFLYRTRKRQLLVCNIQYGLIVLMVVFMYYYGWGKLYIDLEPDTNIVIAILFPLLYAWFNYKAIKGIRHDEELVRSYDRIR